MRFFFWLISVVVADQAWHASAMAQIVALLALGILLILSGAASVQKATSLWLDRKVGSERQAPPPDQTYETRRRVAEALAATPFAVRGVPLSELRVTQVGKDYVVVIDKDGVRSVLWTKGLTEPAVVTMAPEPEVTFDLQPSSGEPGMCIPIYTVTYPAGADSIGPPVDSGTIVCAAGADTAEPTIDSGAEPVMCASGGDTVAAPVDQSWAPYPVSCGTDTDPPSE